MGGWLSRGGESPVFFKKIVFKKVLKSFRRVLKSNLQSFMFFKKIVFKKVLEEF